MTDITKFRNKKTGEVVEIKADFAQASSPISTRWNGDSEWHGTPYQVADARHRRRNALRLVAEWDG